MTLNLFLANSDRGIVLSDRRLIENGRVMDSQATKVATVVGLDGRAVMAFTGLAKFRSFDSSRWLLEAIGAAGAGNRSIAGAVPELLALLQAKVDSLGITRADDRRLSVTLLGYLYGGGGPVAHAWRLSNYEGDRFDRREVRQAGDFVMAAYAQTASDDVLAYPSGFDSAFTAGEQSALVGLLGERRPASAVIGKAIEVMRRIANEPASQGWIGMDYTSAVLPSDPNLPVSAEFHVGTPGNTVYLPSSADLVHGILLADPSVTQETAEPWLVPKTGRNDPCPCGSGLKYKRCHGR